MTLAVDWALKPQHKQIFSDRGKRNWAAYNMYGLLLEQQELYRSAAQAFEK